MKKVFDIYKTVQVSEVNFTDFDQFGYFATGLLVMYLDVNKDGILNDEESHFVIVMLTPRYSGNPYMAAVFRGHMNDITDGVHLNKPNCGIYEVVSFGELNKENYPDKIPNEFKRSEE